MAIKRKEPCSKFHELLQQQIQNEFTASQQYVALAVWFDNSDLPQLAKFFYRQAVEERNHALAITRYLMDIDHHVEIPGTGEVRNDFNEVTELVELALEQEKGVTADFRILAKTAREQDDYQGEQFVQWFLKEQIEEVSKMTTLLNVVRRANGNLFDVENWLAREAAGDDGDSGMPPVAGGKL
ncbi:ferritin [Amycolatopsis acidiphila]|uniref:Ferritin n=1 Tax=Amycolatopsis acidiphila TaxID=715473 RepID=A0A558AMN8_9PSEU|nr:ferritin [Amycolatopsis acidiphila]TVT25490.1 ferritin [Amycolatopsis acidiphila]UIJ60231.1 ferritin [Amycolatopsis acidiphila]